MNRIWDCVKLWVSATVIAYALYIAWCLYWLNKGGW